MNLSYKIEAETPLDVPRELRKYVRFDVVSPASS